MFQSQIQVAFAADENYIQPLGVAIMSLLCNISPDYLLKITVIGDNLSSESISSLKRVSQKENVSIVFPEINFEKFAEFELTYHFTRAAFARLALPDLIEGDKVLYLDCDILVRSDISSLWETNITDFFSGVVVDTVLDSEYGIEHRRKIGMQLEVPYFNSGIMLLNLEECRQKALMERAKVFLLQNPGIGYAEQDGLNVVMASNWLTLHPKWNVQTDTLRAFNDKNRRHKMSQEIIEGVKNPSIVHFTEGFKPWHSENVWPDSLEFFWPYYEEYYQYLNNSPWKPNQSSMSLLRNDFKKYRRKLKHRVKKIILG